MMSMRQFVALYDRVLESRNHDYLCSGVIASTLVNMWRDSNADPVEPRDFFPSLPEAEPEVMEPEQFWQFIQSFDARRGKPN